MDSLAPVGVRRSRSSRDEVPDADGSFLVGRSNYARALRDEAVFVARLRCNVVVVGETGSGKDVFLDEIERVAPNKPLVRIPAGNIVGDLAAGQLFGRDKGAYTGSDRMAHGFGAEAPGGWLAFNDADHLPPAIQELLLTIAEGREFWLLGNTERAMRSNARLIFLTHKPLAALVKRRKLRDDLAFRLDDGVTVAIRPLRQHKEDLPALAAKFLARLGLELSIEPPHLSDEAAKALSRYDFPGNVRELDTMLKRAVHDLLRHNEKVDVLLPRHIDAQIARNRRQAASRVRPREVSAEMMHCAHRGGGTASEVAERLGLCKRSLYRRMKELGMTRS